MGTALSEVILLHPHIGQTELSWLLRLRARRKHPVAELLINSPQVGSVTFGFGCKNMFVCFREARSFTFIRFLKEPMTPEEVRAVAFRDRSLSMLILYLFRGNPQ